MKPTFKPKFKSRVLATFATALALALPIALNAAPQDTPAIAADALAMPGTLQVQSAAGDDVAGSLKTAAGAMSFETSSVDAKGEMAAKGASPDRVRVRLEVNGAVLDHEIDYAAGTLTVHAADEVVISAADREVLKSFQSELGRNLALQGSVRSLPKAHDMLWRLSEMYSEVPLGHRIGKNWVIRRGNDAPMTRQDLSEAREGLLSFGAQAKPRGDIVAAACNDQGGGSFTNLKSIANVCDDDRVFYRSSAHDFCPSHGYSSKTVAYGCGASSCAGRCGAGCGVADGMGAWYQDCLDHDVCNRDHNSQLGGCGDEWTEAADDYAFGAISCYTTCG
ncbi:MAG: hypothetical protein JNM58_10075 [Xanthomonadaceae bacterium]|nr:hypothetical protein [Xanthomonadaceae bacterium]